MSAPRPPAQAPRGVLFDKDGTLFDFARTWEAWARAFLRRIAQDDAHAQRLGAAIGFDTERQSFAPDSVVIAGSPEEVAVRLLPLLPDHGPHGLSRLIDILNVEAARAPQVESVPLVPFFEALRAAGLGLGVLTNDAEMPARAHLSAAGVTGLLDFIAGYDSGHGAKPGPGGLLAFAERMDLPPASCVMVGDSLHDLQAGRAAGFMTVGVLTGYAGPDVLAPFADAVLPDIGHLPAWLGVAQTG